MASSPRISMLWPHQGWGNSFSFQWKGMSALEALWGMLKIDSSQRHFCYSGKQQGHNSYDKSLSLELLYFYLCHNPINCIKYWSSYLGFFHCNKLSVGVLLSYSGKKWICPEGENAFSNALQCFRAVTVKMQVLNVGLVFCWRPYL